MKPSVGLGTIIGYLLTGAAAAATAWATAEGSGSHISPGVLAAITAACGTFTGLGRMYQAKTPEATPPEQEPPV